MDVEDYSEFKYEKSFWVLDEGSLFAFSYPQDRKGQFVFQLTAEDSMVVCCMVSLLFCKCVLYPKNAARRVRPGFYVARLHIPTDGLKRRGRISNPVVTRGLLDLVKQYPTIPSFDGLGVMVHQNPCEFFRNHVARVCSE